MNACETKNYVDFVIVRHGETLWNEKKLLKDKDGIEVMGPLIQGSSDIALNENGLNQAKNAAEFVNHLGFKFTKVYSSPLIRASKTAEVIARSLDLPIIEESALRAGSWGVCEGKPNTFRMDTYGFDIKGNLRLPGWEVMPTKERWKITPIPEAESPHDVYERMSQAFDRMTAESSAGEAILLASHQENLKVFSLFCQAEEVELLRLASKLDSINEMETSVFKNCGYYHFRFDLDSRKFKYFGEVTPKK